MQSKEIRSKFLEFFKSKNHEVVPSDSLVPGADPTLLFTSAGMNQFKEQFLGHNVTYRRAASSQKCLRTQDLDKVGKTPSHHTFFEMLGNFSFGDYFKKEAIVWAWEFMTGVLGIKEKRLWVSVYEKDQDSFQIWRDLIKVPEGKIVKLGTKENFWPSNAPTEGPNGPCGPCSEIFYDWGEDVGCKKKKCNPSCDCGRFVEVWNLVFTQFDRKEDKSLAPLPNRNIDTGMGLERITAVMQGVKTNFETDLFVPIIKKLSALGGKLRSRSATADQPRPPDAGRAEKLKTEDLNAVADHIRAVTFAICDGVAPSNEKRGYVIRKLIRRAYLRSRTHEAFLYNVVPKVAEVMRDCYPELREKSEEISLIVKEEEEKFRHTLSVAMPILKKDLSCAKKNTLDGEKIFRLADTYGLPLEVIETEARKRKIKLDTDTFEKLMSDRRELSRKETKIEEDIFATNLFAEAPALRRSDQMPLKAKIAFMVREKEVVKEASIGDVVEVMTDPQSGMFYTEAGGQVGDTGTIVSDNGESQILNTVKMGDKVIHVAKVMKGGAAVGDVVEINLDIEKRKDIAKNHTATHLLQGALRRVLGEHVHQAGSLVEDKRLRFDFTHMKKLTEREIENVESTVNEYIKKAIDVKKELKPLDVAKKEGAIALFGEKYKEKVTVVSVADYSREVCGGTHVDNTKDIALFKIISESSIGSGMRRIEALTGDEGRKWIEENKKMLDEKARVAKEKEEEKELARKKFKVAEKALDTIVEKAKVINGVKVIIEKVENANVGILRNLSDKIKSKEQGGSSFILLGSENEGKVNLVLTITKDLVSNGLDASVLIKDMAKIVGGSGGGRPDFAQAGGKNPSKLGKVFEFAEKTATDSIGGISK